MTVTDFRAREVVVERLERVFCDWGEEGEWKIGGEGGMRRVVK